MDKKLFAAFERFVERLPPRVAEAARTYPATTCYRSNENPGHYVIDSYNDPDADGVVTVRLTHGRDSYSAGVSVFGVQIGSLVKCDCGKWEPPTVEQCANELRRAEAFHEAQGRCAGCLIPDLGFRHGPFCKRGQD